MVLMFLELVNSLEKSAWLKKKMCALEKIRKNQKNYHLAHCKQKAIPQLFFLIFYFSLGYLAMHPGSKKQKYVQRKDVERAWGSI